MKKILFLALSLCLIVGLVVGLTYKEEQDDKSYLRVHIRANSNSSEDQEVKMKVKEAVVNFLTNKIAAGSTFDEVYEILNDNLKNIESVADQTLAKNGFDYKSRASLNEEFFPTRSYSEYTLEQGYYDALILELGTGQGNNWWCVVYPPLCFIGADANASGNIKYKSKFIEIIQNFFK